MIIRPRWVIPVEPANTVFPHHSVVVDGGRIEAILPTDAERIRYRSEHVVERPAHAVLPGLVNAHTHAAMCLLRGYADDLALEPWLNEHIWPAEARWVDAGFVQLGTALALAEMIRGGTTCFNDMYFFPDIIAQCAEQAGIRASVGLIMLDFPTVWAADPAEYLDKGIAVHDHWRNSALITTAFAPHAPYTVSDAPLKRIRVLADELDLAVHIHLHETRREISESSARHGIRPLERLEQLGLLDTRLQAVHMTQLLDAEIDTLARRGVHVVHCPESNLKLASGTCPAATLARRGVNVALGTDGAASNNDLDMFTEMRSAALLAKGAGDDPTALPAACVLQMATLNGARALGLGDLTGSLLPGKAADLIAVDLSAPRSQPVYDPIVQLVYCASAEQVSDAWVAGRAVLADRRLVNLDQTAILVQVAEFAERINAGRPARQ